MANNRIPLNKVAILASELNELKVACKICGRKEVFTTKIDRKLCSHCNNYIYKDKKAEFKYNLKRRMLNGNRI